MSHPHEPQPAGVTLSTPHVSRRNFLMEAWAAALGAIVGLTPVVSGLLFFINPLGWFSKNGSKGNEYIRVASLASVPEAGQPPLRVQVIADKVDAWTTFFQQPVGAVYLQKEKDGKIVCFNTTCPHLGCSVDYKAADGPNPARFHCPCHDSSFECADGAPRNATPPRGLDTLEVDQEALKNGDVKIKFQNFKTGVHDKVPV